MTYEIKIRPKAFKFIEKQDKVQRTRIYKAIYNLPDGDVKKIAGEQNIFRLRVRRLSNYLRIRKKKTSYFNYKSRQ